MIKPETFIVNINIQAIWIPLPYDDKVNKIYDGNSLTAKANFI